MKIMQVGLIGYGLSGSTFHGPLLKALNQFCVKYIVTNAPAKIEAARHDFPEALIVTDENPLLNDETIDLIVICTPNTLHFPLAKASLMAGKHVVVEKPFTVTSKEAESLVLLANEKNLKLSVYHNRRFDGDFKTLKTLLNKHTLGTPVTFESRFDRYRPEFKINSWREDDLPGSGLLYDLGSHLLDQALTLFGLPQELYAELRSERCGKTDDAFEIHLYYPDLKVTLKASSLIKEPTPRFAVYGTKGAYVIYGLDPQEEALRAGKLPLTLDWGMASEDHWGILNTLSHREKYPTQAGSYPDYYEAIYEAIQNDAELPVTAQDGLRVIQLIEAALESHRTKARVSLSHVE